MPCAGPGNVAGNASMCNMRPCRAVPQSGSQRMHAGMTARLDAPLASHRVNVTDGDGRADAGGRLRVCPSIGSQPVRYCEVWAGHPAAAGAGRALFIDRVCCGYPLLSFCIAAQALLVDAWPPWSGSRAWPGGPANGYAWAAPLQAPLHPAQQRCCCALLHPGH